MSKRKLITDVMHHNKLLSLSPQTTVTAAARKMFERKVGAVMVTSGGKLLGIVTERDINFRVVALGRSPEATMLSEIMTKEPDTLPPNATVDDALEMMHTYGYRHVPVEQKGAVVGVISVRDIFMEVKQDLEDNIHQREEFMFGSGYSVAAVAH